MAGRAYSVGQWMTNRTAKQNKPRTRLSFSSARFAAAFRHCHRYSEDQPGHNLRGLWRNSQEKWSVSRTPSDGFFERVLVSLSTLCYNRDRPTHTHFFPSFASSVWQRSRVLVVWLHRSRGVHLEGSLGESAWSPRKVIRRYVNINKRWRERWRLQGGVGRLCAEGKIGSGPR